jgi:hypothetical protein
MFPHSYNVTIVGTPDADCSVDVRFPSFGIDYYSNDGVNDGANSLFVSDNYYLEYGYTGGNFTELKVLSDVGVFTINDGDYVRDGVTANIQSVFGVASIIVTIVESFVFIEQARQLDYDSNYVYVYDPNEDSWGWETPDGIWNESEGSYDENPTGLSLEVAGGGGYHNNIILINSQGEIYFA